MVFLLYLWGEYAVLKRRLRRFSLRICITGTRGKSSVTRLIASILREAGFSVFAKSTGSRPMLIFPDGREKVIRRSSAPSILEQKRLVRLAAKLKTQGFVAEMMSIQPESLFTESNRLLKPNLMVITNIRRDHLEHWGDSKEHIARCFGTSVPEKCTVFILEEEVSSVYDESCRKKGTSILAVSQYDFLSPEEERSILPGSEFEQNIRLASAVADYLKINPMRIKQGIAKASPDFGGLRVWCLPPAPESEAWYFISAFAANDPSSTRRVLEKLKCYEWWGKKKVIGLLNLRDDRGDRTQQWIEAFRQHAFPELSKLVLLGRHAGVAKRNIRRVPSDMAVLVFKMKSAEKITDALFTLQDHAAVVIGIGNMQGAGEALVHYWEKKGKPYVL